MKADDFRGFVEQLNDLSEVQRAALVAALAGKSSASETVALIETRFAAAPCCGHCKSERFRPWGHASGLKRYKCKDCGCTFNALTGTPLAQLHRREAWLEYARALVDRVSLRKAAKRADISLDTSFRWRHRFLRTARDKRPSVVTGIVEADETLILKSAKGSRQLTGRAPRKRGGKPKKTGTSPDDYDIVLIVRDRHKTTSDHVLTDFEGATFEAVLDPLVSRDSVLVTDGRASYATFASDRGMLHIAVVAKQGERDYDASTSRTSTPTRRASRIGCAPSRASRRNTCRAIWAGAAKSSATKTGSPRATCWPRRWGESYIKVEQRLETRAESRCRSGRNCLIIVGGSEAHDSWITFSQAI